MGKILKGNIIYAQGYLKNMESWHEALAVIIAEREKITLTEAHWDMIRFVRNFYYKFNTSPSLRMLVRALAKKYGEKKFHSSYLYSLFPKGPAKQLSKISGLPKPVQCI